MGCSKFIKIILNRVSRKSPEKFKVGALYIQGWRWSTGFNTSRRYGSHAEDMAIRRFKDKYGVEPKGGTMYCTLSPCTVCTKTLERHNMVSKYKLKYNGKL